MSSDRNLLVGMLALKNGLVEQHQLLEAMAAWMHRRSTPLDAILAEQVGLSGEQREQLGQLADQVTELTDRLLSPLSRHDEAIPPPPNSSARWDSMTRYRPIQLHARGGLGEVYLAEDVELHRQVAVKRMQAPYVDHAEARARFIREAEITGQLEHPGIVPVYGLQYDEVGRPVYAMRMIRGESLQSAIDRLHGADRPKAQPRQLVQRGLLGRFVAICNAVAYAHSRGVIHRDLKPANVMLGDYGETLVVDWGLARRREAKPGELSDLLTLPDGVETALLQPTRQGTLLGTPAFMAPEQARGEVDRVGPASDIWALGAILYCILTGRPPYTHNCGLEQVRQCEFPTPRSLDASIPRALEAICLRAMSAQPEARHESAQALAEEVERYLADEPVTSYREPWTDRLRRWSRRHRAWVTSGVLALLLGVVGLSSSVWALDREQRKTQQALETATKNLSLAQKAVEECFNVCQTDPLFQLPRMERVKKLLLRKTLPFYRQFQQSSPDAIDTAHQQGVQMFRIGVITQQLGELRDALHSYDDAARFWTQAHQANPVEPLYRYNLSLAHYNLGLIHRDLGEDEKALHHYSQAKQFAETLDQEFPNHRDYANTLASILNGIGNLRCAQGQLEAAIPDYERAKSLQLAMTARDPNHRETQVTLARAYGNLGMVFRDLGRDTQAETELREAIRLVQALHQAHPDEAEYAENLASLWNSISIVSSNLGKLDQALRESEQSLQVSEQLARTHPDLPKYQADLGLAHTNLATRYADLRRLDSALEEYLKGRDLFQRLKEADPARPKYVQHLANVRNNLGVHLSNMKRLPEAIEEHREATRLREQLHYTYPHIPEYKAELSQSLFNLGITLGEHQQVQESLSELHRSLTLRLELVKAFPKVVAHRRSVAQTRYNLGAILARHNQLDPALQYYQAAYEDYAALARSHPRIPEYRIEASRILLLLCNHYQQQGLHLRILNETNHLLESIRIAREQSPKSVIALDLYKAACWFRARSLDAVGNHREAAETWERLIQVEKSLNDRPRYTVYRAEALARAGDYSRSAKLVEEVGRNWLLAANRLMDLARIQAINSQSVLENATRPLAEREKRSRELLQSAMGYLRRCARWGYFAESEHYAELAQHPDLTPLREQPEFQAFVQSLPAPKQPPKP